MKEKPSDAGLLPHVRSSLWVARHYKQILFFSIGLSATVFIFSLLSVLYMVRTLSEQNRVINNMANKVIFVRADGAVGILDKQPITASPFQLYLKNLVVSYVVVSAFDFDMTPDFSKSVKFQVVKAHLDERGLKGYRAYLERIYMSYKNNNLPEVISATDMDGAMEDFRYQNGQFIYNVTLPLEIRYVYAERLNMGKGLAEVLLRGYQTPSKSSVYNPLGIVITHMEVKRYVSKGEAGIITQ